MIEPKLGGASAEAIDPRQNNMQMSGITIGAHQE
jgi:hypothetical protein